MPREYDEDDGLSAKDDGQIEDEETEMTDLDLSKIMDNETLVEVEQDTLQSIYLVLESIDDKLAEGLEILKKNSEPLENREVDAFEAGCEHQRKIDAGEVDEDDRVIIEGLEFREDATKSEIGTVRYKCICGRSLLIVLPAPKGQNTVECKCKRVLTVNLFARTETDLENDSEGYGLGPPEDD